MLPAFLSTPFSYKSLIINMIKRDITERYRGSFLGILWSLITPILLLTIYTFVFSFVFKARWGQEQSNQYEFAVVLFAGLIIYNLFAECLGRAPQLILNNVNYVKKVVFPLEILPWVSLGSALFHAFTSLCILLLFLPFTGHTLSITCLWLPVIIMPFLLLIIGVSWFLAATGVFMRDINQLMNMLLTMLMFMSPIFYPLSALPEQLQGLLYLNPITLIVEQVRAVLIWGVPPDGNALMIYSAVAIILYSLGGLWFQKTRKGFADVL